MAGLRVCGRAPHQTVRVRSQPVKWKRWAIGLGCVSIAVIAAVLWFRKKPVHWEDVSLEKESAERIWQFFNRCPRAQETAKDAPILYALRLDSSLKQNATVSDANGNALITLNTQLSTVDKIRYVLEIVVRTGHFFVDSSQ